GIKAALLFGLAMSAIRVDKTLILILFGLGLSAAIGYTDRILELENIRFLSKYLSPFIYLYGFKSLTDTPQKKVILIKFVIGFIYLGIVSILIGFLFKIESFR